MAVSKEDILEAISNMSVMDVVALVKSMEEKFGRKLQEKQKDSGVKQLG